MLIRFSMLPAPFRHFATPLLDYFSPPPCFCYYEMPIIFRRFAFFFIYADAAAPPRHSPLMIYAIEIRCRYAD